MQRENTGGVVLDFQIGDKVLVELIFVPFILLLHLKETSMARNNTEFCIPFLIRFCPRTDCQPV